jgi:transposase
MYEVYLGSIVDVSTLSNTVKMLRDHGVEECMLVLDRGFFSVTSIEQLQRERINYIISAPYSLKSVKMALSKAQKSP